VYAWVFAYWLVLEKGKMFEARGGDKDFIYEEKELLQTLISLIRDSGFEHAEEICKRVKERLKNRTTDVA